MEIRLVLFCLVVSAGCGGSASDSMLCDQMGRVYSKVEAKCGRQSLYLGWDGCMKEMASTSTETKSRLSDYLYCVEQASCEELANCPK